jgi:hypothetical protein
MIWSRTANNEELLEYEDQRLYDKEAVTEAGSRRSSNSNSNASNILRILFLFLFDLIVLAYSEQ